MESPVEVNQSAAPYKRPVPNHNFFSYIGLFVIACSIFSGPWGIIAMMYVAHCAEEKGEFGFYVGILTLIGLFAAVSFVFFAILLIGSA